MIYLVVISTLTDIDMFHSTRCTPDNIVLTGEYLDPNRAVRQGAIGNGSRDRINSVLNGHLKKSAPPLPRLE